MVKYFAHHHRKYQQLSLFSDMAAAMEKKGNDDLCYVDIPEISPVLKKYMIVNWVSIVQDDPGMVMPNFEVSRLFCFDDNNNVYLNDYPWELMLSEKDSKIFGRLVKNNYRLWFKCISDPRMLCVERFMGVHEEGEIDERMGQTGFLCIRLNNDAKKINICQDYYEHLEYKVIVKDGWPWPSTLSYDPDLC